MEGLRPRLAANPRPERIPGKRVNRTDGWRVEMK
jgi:hypothetical protein